MRISTGYVVASKKWPFCQDSSWKSLHRSHRDRWSNLSLCECVRFIPILTAEKMPSPARSSDSLRFCFQKNEPEAKRRWDVNKSNKHISRWIVHNWDNRYSIIPFIILMHWWHVMETRLRSEPSGANNSSLWLTDHWPFDVFVAVPEAEVLIKAIRRLRLNMN